MSDFCSFRSLFYAFLIAAFAGSALSAAVSERDWKTPGDGLLTFDTVNKREWLDLSQSILDDRFPGTGADFLEIRESRYQYVVGQTAPGGLFEGFSVAKSPDVIAFAQSAGIDALTLDYSTNSTPTLQLAELLSFTAEPPNGFKYSIGLLDEFGYLASPYRLASIVYWGHTAGLIRDDPVALQIYLPPGVMLYRVVPEPSCSVLVLVVAFALKFNRQFTGRH